MEREAGQSARGSPRGGGAGAERANEEPRGDQMGGGGGGKGAARLGEGAGPEGERCPISWRRRNRERREGDELANRGTVAEGGGGSGKRALANGRREARGGSQWAGGGAGRGWALGGGGA